MGQSIFYFAMSWRGLGRRLAQYCVICRLDDWAHRKWDCVGPSSRITGNKMASSNLQTREQPSDRPEPAQINRDGSLKQTKSKYNTRDTSCVNNSKYIIWTCFVFLFLKRKSSIIFKIFIKFKAVFVTKMFRDLSPSQVFLTFLAGKSLKLSFTSEIVYQNLLTISNWLV